MNNLSRFYVKGMIVLLILGMSTISISVLSAQVIEGVDYSDRSHVYQTFDLTTNDEVGQRFASESLTYVDEDRLYFISRPERDHSIFYQIDLDDGTVTELLAVPIWANHLQANRWVSGEMIYS